MNKKINFLLICFTLFSVVKSSEKATDGKKKKSLKNIIFYKGIPLTGLGYLLIKETSPAKEITAKIENTKLSRFIGALESNFFNKVKNIHPNLFVNLEKIKENLIPVGSGSLFIIGQIVDKNNEIAQLEEKISYENNVIKSQELKFEEPKSNNKLIESLEKDYLRLKADNKQLQENNKTIRGKVLDGENNIFKLESQNQTLIENNEKLKKEKNDFIESEKKKKQAEAKKFQEMIDEIAELKQLNDELKEKISLNLGDLTNEQIKQLREENEELKEENKELKEENEELKEENKTKDKELGQNEKEFSNLKSTGKIKKRRKQ